MALNLIETCRFFGPALPEPFVKFDLEQELAKLGVLSKTTGTEGAVLEESWRVYQRKLRELATRGGALRVRSHVVEPLVQRLGYARIEDMAEVTTREGRENGGMLLVSADGQAKLRVWATSFEEDLDAPAKRGAAYRYSHLRIAQRVLLACGERMGLLTNGVELRILISDPARPDSQVILPVDPEWKMSRSVPDSYRLLLALCCPVGVKAIPDLVEKARHKQSAVTKELRRQAREAIAGFVQEVLDHPANREQIARFVNRDRLSRQLWREGLILVYRLLFILKLESTDDDARSFSFASTSLWRNTFSPSTALAPYARKVIDRGDDTGGLLEAGLRALFSLFSDGLQCTELNVSPLGGALFGKEVTPVLSGCHWGERAAAHLLDQLLWTSPKRGSISRERVHYGTLDVEDLGRVYEALLELEPGIAAEPMCRLRRQKLEVVVPLAQGEKYRGTAKAGTVPSPFGRLVQSPFSPETELSPPDEPDIEVEPEEDDDAPTRGKKTKVEWIEAIPAGRFYLRVGLGRKATGSFYTPHSFVRFLVQETLGPQVAERSPQDNPNPLAILKLKVLDPAMGSGHFLVEACRFLGEKLYEACRLCDEKAIVAEKEAEKAKSDAARVKFLEETRVWRQRVIDLPDPDDELVRYLPSRAPEGEESGYSQRKAEALCRRLVAVHCLYGVDKNPLAVELAKLSLWIESHAEGLPLTFLDHRFIVGDSLAGPFFEHLLKFPGTQQPLDDLFTQGLREQLARTLTEALHHIHDLEATVGTSLAEMEQKQQAKERLDAALKPFKILAAAWAGGVMLGRDNCDDTAYAQLAQQIATGETPVPDTFRIGRLGEMIAFGLDMNHTGHFDDTNAEPAPAIVFDLAFPEVFYPSGVAAKRSGFATVLGNPPWDAIQFKSKEFFVAFDFEIMSAPTKRERAAIEGRLLKDSEVCRLFEQYKEDFERQKRANDRLQEYQKVRVDGDLAGRQIDAFRVFMERNAFLLSNIGMTGVVVPSAFHANEGATGIRQLYLERMGLKCCYSFENKRKLFEIHSSFKFALVVAAAYGPSAEFSCAFYLHDDEWLFGDRAARPPLDYTLEFVKRTGGEYLSLLELQNTRDLGVALQCFHRGRPFGQVCDELGIRFGAEFHMTNDAWRFTPTTTILPNGEDPRDPDIADRLLHSGYLVLHEGKTFWHYDDRWEQSPRYLIHETTLDDKPTWKRNSAFFRLSYRDVSGSGNERTIVFALLPFSSRAETARTEFTPMLRNTGEALTLAALSNTLTFDFLGRLKISAHVQYFLLSGLPLPDQSRSRDYLSHSSLRLTCNHAGYAPLWREQLGDAWREPKPAFTWPVLEGDDARWAVRAAIDAVVADAYGLDRDQYAHVLSTFSHKSYPKAPALCLARFDELKQIGLDAFTKKYDPYWDIPLNENLPQPVIDLPTFTDQQSAIDEHPTPKKRRAGPPQQHLEFSE